jgi:ribosomal protein S18 acetylase RimI-like enzyme
VNVHDLHVAPRFQRRGIARRLLAAVEARARALGCCKLTLEVQARNGPARALYRSFGFAGGAGAPEAEATLFLEKRLS